MSDTELGLRVTLTGAREAASGLREVAQAQRGAAEANKTLGESARNAAEASRQAAAGTREQGQAAREAAEETRRLAAEQRSSMLDGVRGAGAFGGAIRSLVGAVAGLAAAQKALDWARWWGEQNDQARVSVARIAQITGSLQEARAVVRGLAEDSQRLRVAAAETTTGYTRIAAAVRELNGTQRQARELNEAVIATAKISGVTSAEATAAARQFAQALGSGVLQGDELRSILENNQELARQLAKALGVSVGELRKLGEEGKLTADRVANALLSQLPEIRAKLSEVPLTTAEAWTKLKAAMANWLVQGDQVEMKAGAIANMMNSFADSIDRARAQAAKPIIINVVERRAVESAGGAAFVGPNGARRGGQIVAQTLSAEENATEIQRLIARTEQASTLGLQQAAKAVLKGLSEYADSVELGSVRLRKKFEEEIKKIEPVKARLREVIALGGKAGEEAQAELARITEVEARAAANAARKIAEAQRSEMNRGAAETRRDAAQALQTRLAEQEGLQRQIAEAARAGEAELRAVYEDGLITYREFFAARAALRQAEIDQIEASVRAQLELTRRALAAGDKTRADDAKRYEAELRGLASRRAVIEAEAQREISRAQRRGNEQMLRDEREFQAARAAFAERTVEVARSIEEQNEALREQLTLLGADDAVRARARIEREAEISQRRLITDAWREYMQVLERAMTMEQEQAATAAYNARVAAIREATAEQRALGLELERQRDVLAESTRFWDGFFSAARRGWRGLRDYAQQVFFSWLQRQLVQQITVNLNVAGGSAGGLFNVLGSLFSGGSGGAGGGVGGGLLGMIGGGLSTVGNLMGFGSLSGLLGTMPFVAGAGPIAAGTGLAGMIGGALGGAIASFASFLPMLGPLVVLAPLLSRLFKNKDGLWFDFWGEGQQGFRAMNPGTGLIQTALGTIAAQGEVNLSRDAPNIVSVFQTLAQGFATAFGEALTAQARATIGRWTGFSERGRGTEYENAEQYAAALRTESKDVMAEFFGRAFAPISQRISQEILNWAGSADELANHIREILNAQTALVQQGPALRSILGEALGLERLIDLRREGETLAETLSRVVGVFALTNQVAEWLGKGADAFGAVGLASLAARERLVELAGGAQALAQNLGTYLNEFFTEEERALREREIAARQVNAVFAELGLAVPATREAFRALVEGIDLSSEAGQQLFAALIKIAPAFAVMTREIEQTAQALRDISREEAEFRELFYSQEERAAMRAAEALAEVTTTFARLGIAIPESREAFRGLVESIDRSTPEGEALYRALILVARAFFDATQATRGATAAVNDYYAVIGQVIAESGGEMQRRIGAVFGLIDAASDSWTVRLAQRRAWLEGQLAGGALFGPERAALENALADTLRLIDVLIRAGQAAPGMADAMFETQRWYEEQVALAAGNAQLLLLIEQEYQRRRQEILTGGLSTGLGSLAATIRDWLNRLLLDERLSTLTPAQRLAEAERQYQLALAGGDGQAITRAAEAYLAEARGMYASGAQYQAIFSAIVAQLAAIASGSTLPVTTPNPGATGTPGNGNLTGGAVGAVVTATNNLTSATNDLLTAIAQATAATRNAVEAQGQATRANDNAIAERLIAARVLAPAPV